MDGTDSPVATDVRATTSKQLERESSERSALADFWLRFRRNHSAVAAAAFLVTVHLLVFLAPMIAPYSPESIDLDSALAGFSTDHWLGTDENGRDVFTRLLYGGRISLIVGLAAVLISGAIGITMGATTGYLGGWADSVGMRITDAFLSIPTFFMLLTILTLFGISLSNIVLVIGVTSWMPIARIVRGDVLRIKHEEFIVAARVNGARDVRIVLKHVLPQAVPSIIVAATIGIALAIIVESSLSFLGLGIQPPLPSWGNMLSNSQFYVWSAPRLAIYPGILILLTVLAYNVVGNALRDTLDPSLRNR